MSARVIVVMGVSGCGKTHVAQALAVTFGARFQEGDALHPDANIAKMHAGHPLTDADRAPWLDRVADWIGQTLAAGEDGVITCSALKRAYRDRLRRAGPGVRFVYLRVAEQELARRMRTRQHFMPPQLLRSQLDTLEEPHDEADALTVDGSLALPDEIALIQRELDAT